MGDESFGIWDAYYAASLLCSISLSLSLSLSQHLSKFLVAAVMLHFITI